MARQKPIDETDGSSPGGGTLSDLASHLDEALDQLNKDPNSYLVLHDHDDRPIGVMLSYKAYERLRRDAERDDDVGLPVMLPTKKHEEPIVAGKLSLLDIQKILDAANLSVEQEQKKKRSPKKKA